MRPDQTMMMEEKYNLTWSTFTSHSRELFTGLLETGDLTDVTLVCDDLREIRAHKLILSGCSPVLARIIKFSSGNVQPVIHLRGSQYEDVIALVQFMYLGETAVTQQRVIKFLNLARDFGMKEIGRECAINGKRKGVVETGSSGVMKTEKQSRNQKTQLRPEAVPKKMKAEKKRKISLPANIEMYPASELTSSTPTPAVHQDDPPPPPTFLTEGEISITEATVYVEREEGEMIPATPPSQYKCSDCNATYSDKTQWKTHFNSQHGGKNFPCSLCPFQGTKRADLKNHVKTSHF